MTVKEAALDLEWYLGIPVGSGVFVDGGPKIVIYSDDPPSDIPIEWEGYEVIIRPIMKPR